MNHWLVLHRSRGEAVRLRINGQDIWVAVQTHGHGGTRIAFGLPPGCMADREELLPDSEKIPPSVKEKRRRA